MNVLDVVYVVSVPVSRSVRFIWYSLMMPCLSSRGGGSHVR